MNLSLRVEKEFLPFVNKPGRYTGNEYNVVKKDPDLVDVRALLALGRAEEAIDGSQEFVGLRKCQDDFAVALHVIGPDDVLGPTTEHRQGLDVLSEEL